MNYKHYTYYCEIEYLDDNKKIYHFINGEQIDYTPYETMNFEAFQMFVDLGFPPRIKHKAHSSPWDKKSIIQTWIGRKK